MPQEHIIFVVDDDLEDQSFFSMALERINIPFKCLFVSSGLAALDKFHNEPGFTPDFIFIDLNMPLMDGTECLAEIHKIERFAQVPIYVYSTANDKDVTEKLIESGASGTLQKKPSINELKNMLCEVFAKHNLIPA